MFLLKYRKSRSKNYPYVEKLAGDFDNHIFDGELNIIDMTIKEIFEKWDSFNLIFWRVVDWQGASFGYEGNNFHSHSDKTRIFYALQWAHSTWINMSVSYLKNIAPAYYDEEAANQAKALVMKEYNILDFDNLFDRALEVHGER